MTYRIKALNEGFFNPYDEKEEPAKKTPVSLADKVGTLSPRKEIFNINRVEYSKRPNGEFVMYARTQFAKGEIVEICPIIFVGVEAKAVPNLKNYVFEIEKHHGKYGIVLGYGSLYKHSETPNLEFAYNRTNRQMYFIAARTIQAQEELSINYGKDFWDEFATFNTIAPETAPTTVNVPAVKEGAEAVHAEAENPTGEQIDPQKPFYTTSKSTGRVNIAPLGGGQS
jgi:hypothetical protein